MSLASDLDDGSFGRLALGFLGGGLGVGVTPEGLGVLVPSGTLTLTGVFVTGLILIFGIALVLIQKKFGLIKMGNGGFIIDSYPILLQASDVFFVFLIVFIIGFLAAWYPSKFLIKKFIS